MIRNSEKNSLLTHDAYKERVPRYSVIVDSAQTAIHDDGIELLSDGTGWLLRVLGPDISAFLHYGQYAQTVRSQRILPLSSVAALQRIQSGLNNWRWGLTDRFFQPAFSVNIPFSRSGAFGDVFIDRCVTRARFLTTYDHVTKSLQDPADIKHAWSYAALEAVRVLHGQRTQQRSNLRKIAAQYSGIQFAEQPTMTKTGHSIVLESMIAANTAWARIARQEGISAIYMNVLTSKDATANAQVRQAVDLALPLDPVSRRALMDYSLPAWQRPIYTLSPIGRMDENVDAYAPVTSPLKRLGDMVNILQWDAYDRNAADLISPSLLEPLIDHLNTAQG